MDHTSRFSMPASPVWYPPSLQKGLSAQHRRTLRISTKPINHQAMIFASCQKMPRSLRLRAQVSITRELPPLSLHSNPLSPMQTYLRSLSVTTRGSKTLPIPLTPRIYPLSPPPLRYMGVPLLQTTNPSDYGPQCIPTRALATTASFRARMRAHPM